MTDLMKQAIDAVSKLPGDRQDELARYLLHLALAPKQPVDIGEEERAAVAEAEAQLARGERVPDEVVRAFWNRHGL
jgi:hypothetical protein